MLLSLLIALSLTLVGGGQIGSFEFWPSFLDDNLLKGASLNDKLRLFNLLRLAYFLLFEEELLELEMLRLLLEALVSEIN